MSKVLSSHTPAQSHSMPAPPRIVAISGIVFAALFIVSLVLVRLAVPADAADPGVWLVDPILRNRVLISLNLAPFAGIAFLWFMAVLRNHIGLLEDRFFATVFIGSGLIFVAMLFAAVAVSRGLLETFASGADLTKDREAYRIGRGMAHALMNTFGMRMAAVFMFATSTIVLRTRVLSRWVSFVGFAFGLILLLVITDFAWIALLFPLWAILVSVSILLANFRQGRPAKTDRKNSVPGTDNGGS